MTVLQAIIELGFILVNNTVINTKSSLAQAWSWLNVRINLRTDANSFESLCSDTKSPKIHEVFD